MENLVIPLGLICGGAIKYIPIFILRLKPCVYEFVRTDCSMQIGPTMVTQQMWKDIMDYNPSNYRGDNISVNNISYFRVQEFITNLTGLTYELSREEEWCLVADE